MYLINSYSHSSFKTKHQNLPEHSLILFYHIKKVIEKKISVFSDECVPLTLALRIICCSESRCSTIFLATMLRMKGYWQYENLEIALHGHQWTVKCNIRKLQFYFKTHIKHAARWGKIVRKLAKINKMNSHRKFFDRWKKRYLHLIEICIRLKNWRKNIAYFKPQYKSRWLKATRIEDFFFFK